MPAAAMFPRRAEGPTHREQVVGSRALSHASELPGLPAGPPAAPQAQLRAPAPPRRRGAPSGPAGGTPAPQAAQLAPSDARAIAGIQALWLEDSSVGSCGRQDQLALLPALFLACRRPAASALRRRYLGGLGRWPRDDHHGLYGSPDVGHRLDEAIGLCRLLAAPTSQAWRNAEARIYRALPAVYQGREAPAPSSTCPSLSLLIGELQNYPEPDQCPRAIARWTFFSTDMTSFDEQWCAFLHAMSDAQWHVVASLRAAKRPQRSASPLSGHRRTLRSLCRHTEGAWRQEVLPRVRRLGDTRQRLDVVREVIGLSAPDAAGALDVVIGGAWPDSGLVPSLRAWLAVPADYREEMSRHVLSTARLSAPLLAGLASTACWPRYARSRFTAALVDLASQGLVGRLSHGHVEALSSWYRWQGEPLSWEGLCLLTELEPAATARYAAYARSVPPAVLPLLRELCSAQRDDGASSHRPSGAARAEAVVQACCDAYLMGAGRRGCQGLDAL